MRDIRQDGREHDQRVEAADTIAAAQTSFVQSLQPDDGSLPEARRVLRDMQRDAATAEFNRALACYTRGPPTNEGLPQDNS